MHMKEKKKLFARYLRIEQTNAEKVVWELLRNRKFKGVKFRRQHVIEGFVVDFYCHELKLGIEIDGSIHLKRKDYDRIRQEIIESKNIKILRITNKDIKEKKRSILDRINKAMAGSASPSPPGGCPITSGNRRMNFSVS